MIKMNFKTIPVGMLQVNCYLVPVEQSQTLYIIDPGGNVDDIMDAAKSFKYEKAVILMTHGHVDHISACGELKERMNIQDVYIHENELELYHDPDNCLLPWVPAAKDLPEPNVAFESDDYDIIETPGHSKGGVCYYFKDIPALFSGDTIFKRSIGRTDLPGGHLDTLMKSIREKVLTLPKELNIYPGHGDSTSVEDEKLYNPFI